MKLFREITQRLSTIYPASEASAIVRWVMEDRFDLSLTDLMMDKDSDLSSFQLQELEIITERLLQKEPIQYILGHTCFCGLNIGVRPGVLIPRPETEELVAWITREYDEGIRPSTRVLDIGTGSGCIALALAHAGFQVEAWDISREALEVAKNNATQLGLEVKFSEKDILHIQTEYEAFDVIVSNPPYICMHEAEEMEPHVIEHEPHLALFVPDEDPLLFYRHIALYAQGHLSPGGRLFFEINRAYGPDTCKMLSDIGFKDVTLHNDQFGNARMVMGRMMK